MNNRELIETIEKQRSIELSAINYRYGKILNPLYTKITLKQILKAGWVYDCYYPAGMEDYYKKDNSRIRVKIVDNKIKYILTDGSFSRTPCDLEDLEHYNKTGK